MSNLVVSRRAIQRVLDQQLQPVLTPSQLKSLVERLNRPGDQRLPAMWETLMLGALAMAGGLRHEVPLPDGRRPDIELQVSQPGEEPLLIVGDIATVSDAGLDEQNPVEALSQELTRLATRHGLNPNHLGYDVRGSRVGPYGEARVKLFLPERAALLKLMKDVVEPWIKEQVSSPLKASQFNYAAGEIAFTLTYDPTQRYSRGGYLAYDVAESRSKNPLFRALKAKVAQLRAAPAKAMRLLIACDGDCAIMRNSHVMISTGGFNAAQIAEDFLRQNSSIDFVLLVTVNEQHAFYNRTSTYRMRYNLVVAPERERSARVTAPVIDKIQAVLRSAAEHVPVPVRAPYQAAHRCQQPGPGPDMIGGYRMSGNKVSISSRALHRLLAGEMSSEEFLAAHDWHGGRNPFRRMLHGGQMVTAVRVEGGGDKDDDELEFSFGSSDAAAGPFRVREPRVPNEDDINDPDGPQ